MTVFTITYNEQLMLPFFINHYRSRFPNCNIVVFDNESTDNTVKIALENDCEVITYKTNGKLDDTKYLEIKNNCWKVCNGWVIVADCDELIDISNYILTLEENEGNTLLRFNAFNMVNMADNLDIDSINYGLRAESYDKSYCFDARFVSEINYSAGCHSASPIGSKISYSNYIYNAYHYKYINPDYMVIRHANFAKRLSEINLKKGYGGHYLQTESQIRNEFLNARKNAKLIWKI